MNCFCYLELLHFGPSQVLTKTEYSQFNFSGMSDLFGYCFRFNLSRDYDDYSVMANFLHGSAFDGFVLVEIQNNTKRRVIGTLSLSNKKLSNGSNLILVYNLCLHQEYHRGSKGRDFMTAALKLLYQRASITPSAKSPVMIGLSLIVTSPAFEPACKSYLNQGFYWYAYGNVAYMKDKFLIDKLNEISTQGMSADMTIIRRDFTTTTANSKLSSRMELGSELKNILCDGWEEPKPLE